MTCRHCNGKIKTSTLFYRLDETFISLPGDACLECHTPNLTLDQKKELEIAVNEYMGETDFTHVTIEYIGALDD